MPLSPISQFNESIDGNTKNTNKNLYVRNTLSPMSVFSTNLALVVVLNKKK